MQSYIDLSSTVYLQEKSLSMIDPAFPLIAQEILALLGEQPQEWKLCGASGPTLLCPPLENAHLQIPTKPSVALFAVVPGHRSLPYFRINFSTDYKEIGYFTLAVTLVQGRPAGDTYWTGEVSLRSPLSRLLNRGSPDMDRIFQAALHLWKIKVEENRSNYRKASLENEQRARRALLGSQEKEHRE